MVRERLVAFVLSAAIIGLAGALYAHFLGVVNPDAFYMNLTFITLSMLVVGGMNSLSGAVVGVVALSSIIEALRWLEKGDRCRLRDALYPERDSGDRDRSDHDRHPHVPSDRIDAES